MEADFQGAYSGSLDEAASETAFRPSSTKNAAPKTAVRRNRSILSLSTFQTLALAMDARGACKRIPGTNRALETGTRAVETIAGVAG